MTIRIVVLVELLSFLFSYALLIAEVETFYLYIEGLLIMWVSLGSIMFIISVFRAFTSNGPGSAMNILLSVVGVLIPLAFVFGVFSQVH